jgi:hypothetical protein
MIEIDHTYHVVELEKLTIELVNWLNEFYGPPGPRWWISHYCVYFKDSRDHLMFVLRWSSTKV